MKLEYPEKTEQFHLVQFMGSLDNQMFQYAFGRLLEYETGNKVYYGKDPDQVLKISKLGVNVNFMKLDRCRISKTTIKHIVKNSIKQIFSKKLFLKRYEEKAHHHFDENVFQVKENHYFYGYWQSWKYLDMLQKHIQNIFHFPDHFAQKHKQLLSKFHNNNSVAIHVRRGDYLSNLTFNKVHRVCSIEYYDKAIKQLKEIIPTISIHWFSDDRDWVQEHLLPVFGGTFVQGDSDLEDLYLMSQCKHNIIANSSFSWWAAYLNKHKEKIVFYPQKWYAVKDRQIPDLCPLDWKSVK